LKHIGVNERPDLAFHYDPALLGLIVDVKPTAGNSPFHGPAAMGQVGMQQIRMIP
jgi:hypothetical protein